MKKRQINEELVDVWAGMMAEKVSRARERLAKPGSPVQSAGLAGYVDGLTQALALMSSLEKGRFARDYERLRKEVTGDGEGDFQRVPALRHRKEQERPLRDSDLLPGTVPVLRGVLGGLQHPVRVDQGPGKETRGGR